MQELGEFSIEPDHPCLAGHFPGHPLVPGVVILDKTLQLLAARDRALHVRQLSSAKFLEPLYPSQSVTVYIEQTKPQQINFVCKRGDEAICKGVVNLD